MNLYNLVPALNGKKSLIAGYGLLLSGIGGLLMAAGDCLQHLEVAQCYESFAGAYEPFMAALMGLGILGVSHKQEKANA